MMPMSPEQRAALETNSCVLRERERTLRSLTQSARCSNRAGAEMELARVREQLASTYAQLRQEPPSGFVRSVYTRR